MLERSQPFSSEPRRKKSPLALLFPLLALRSVNKKLEQVLRKK